MSLRADFVRITIKEGAKDHFLLCLAIEAPVGKEDMGQLFTLVEISRKWLSPSIGQSIVGMLSRTYYKNSSTSDLENFELAVGQVNRLLASLAEQGDTEWVGSLHSSLLLVNDSVLHVATTGEMPVWLLRDNHLTIVTEPKNSQATTPIKTFNDIVSGNLLPGDVLFAGSINISGIIPKNNLKEWLMSATPFEAGLNLVKALKKRRVKESIGLIIAISPKTSPQTKALPSVIYLDQPTEPLVLRLKKTFVSFLKIATAAITNILDITRQRLAKLLVKTSPITKQLSERSLTLVKYVTTKKRPVDQASPHSVTRPIQQTQVSNQSLVGRTIFTIHDYKAARTIRIRFSPKRIVSKLVSFAYHPKRLLRAPNKPVMPLIGAIILGIFLIGSIAWQKNQAVKRKIHRQQEQILAEATKHLQDGKTALVFNNRKAAQTAFTSAIEQAHGLTENSSFAHAATEIINQAQQQLDTLTGVTRFKDLKAVATATSLASVVVFEGRLLTIQNNNPTILELNPIDPNPTTLATLSDSPLPIRPLLVDNVLFIITLKTLEKINLESKQITVLAPTPQSNFSAVVDLKLFGTALYALQPSLNKVAKIPLDKESLGTITNYLKKGDVKNMISLAIDGAIYVLKGDGTVTKYSHGERQEFSLSNIPKPTDAIVKPLQVDTSEATPSIFVVDANPQEPRIVEFDKNGKYLHQFVLPNTIGELKSVFYQLKSRKAWVVLGDSVYEINL